MKKPVFLLALSLFLLIPSLVSAHYDYTGYKWPSSSTCYDTDPLSSSYEDAADVAADRWNNSGANFTLKIEYIFTECSNDMYMEDLTSYEEAKGKDVIAYVDCKAKSGTKDITECDTYFDSKESWTLDTSKDVDFIYVATHEFGHWLKLHDLSSGSDHLMYGGYTGKDDLHLHDIDGIKAIYP
jgi:hypothetical protein